MLFKRVLFFVAGAWLASLAMAQSDGSGYVVQPGTVVDNFEAGGWAKWDLGIVENSSARARSGLTSLKMVATPGSEVLARKPMTLNLTQSTTVGFWVYVDQPAQYDLSTVVGVSLSNDNFSSEMWASTDNLRQGWNKVVFSRADFKSRNGAGWGAFTHVQLRLYDMGWPSTVYFDDLMVGQFTRPKVVISFDDAYDDHYTEAFQYMRTLGLPGTCYINSSFIGKANRLSEAQCQEMYDAGWDMANHTDTHANLTLLSPADQEAEISRCRNYLINKGWTRRNGHMHFAYPYGFYNQDTFASLQNVGMLTARTTWEARQANVLDEKYLLYGQLPENIRSTPALLIDLLDHFVQAGGLFEISYHMIVTWTPENSNQIHQSEFRQVINYIAQLKAQGLVDVVTKSEWYEGLTGAALSGLLLDKSQIVGGQGLSGKVMLNQAAEASGVAVSLVSNSTSVSVPSSVTVPQGMTIANFAISTSTVASETTATITASRGQAVFSSTLIVRPVVALASLSLSQTTVVAGQNSILTAILNKNADSLFTISLASSSTLVTLPATVTVPATVNQGSVVVKTNTSISSDMTATLTAQANGVTKTIKLTVKRLPILNSFSLSSNDVKWGTTVTATVKVDRVAPSGGCVITIPAKDYVSMPTSVTIPAGSYKATFSVQTLKVTTKKTVTLEAKYNGVTKTRSLTIRP